MWLTSVAVHSVGRVILRVQRVLQMKLGELQHSLDHILDINCFWHVWRRHYVECSQTGIGRFSHTLHYEITPQTLLVHRFIILQMHLKINQ